MHIHVFYKAFLTLMALVNDKEERRHTYCNTAIPVNRRKPSKKNWKAKL